MITIDTNLIVRLLTNDDPGQARRAAKTMAKDEIFVPKTVILETEWVLRHAYGIEKTSIISGFKKLMGLSNVRVEDQQAVDHAMTWFESGLDFADALHLASSKNADRFETFDKAFIKKTEKLVSIEMASP